MALSREGPVWQLLVAEHLQVPGLNYVIKTNTSDSKDIIQEKKSNVPHRLFANYMLKSY